MNAKNSSSKIKVIKHDDSEKKTYRSKSQKQLDEEVENDYIKINDDPESSTAKDNNTGTLLPFIEKIIATPLHFMKFNSNNKNADESTEQYIIIGEKDTPKQKEQVSNTQNRTQNTQKADETPAYRPK